MVMSYEQGWVVGTDARHVKFFRPISPPYLPLFLQETAVILILVMLV